MPLKHKNLPIKTDSPIDNKRIDFSSKNHTTNSKHRKPPHTIKAADYFVAQVCQISPYPFLRISKSPYMFEKKYERLPQAGDTENKFGTEFIYLSPMPVPTGMPAFSARNLHQEANETYLDFSVGRGNFEFMARVGIGVVMFFIIFLFLATGYLSWLRRNFEPFL